MAPWLLGGHSIAEGCSPQNAPASLPSALRPIPLASNSPHNAQFPGKNLPTIIHRHPKIFFRIVQERPYNGATPRSSQLRALSHPNPSDPETKTPLLSVQPARGSMGGASRLECRIRRPAESSSANSSANLCGPFGRFRRSTLSVSRVVEHLTAQVTVHTFPISQLSELAAEVLVDRRVELDEPPLNPQLPAASV